MTAEEIWRAKSDEDLLLAARQLSDYTTVGQAIILAELDRRHLARASVDKNDTVPIRGPSRAHKRVGGWIVLFCLGPLLFGPILALRLLGFLIAPVLYNGSVRALWTEAALDAAAGLALLAFGVVVGVQLLRIRANAVKLTMTFLAATVGYAVFGAVTPLLFGDAIRESQVRNIGLAAVFAAIWAAYFKMSKRVAATYDHLHCRGLTRTGQPTNGDESG